MSQWIDFKKLRRELNFEQVLNAYGVALNIRDTDKGRQHSGPCPLPACKTKPQAKIFSANLDHDMWQCFGCRNKGNALDFIALLEGLNPSNGGDVRKAALIAQEKFLVVSKNTETTKASEEVAPASSIETVINAPLDFVLKSLDASHPWFEANGLSKKTVEHFGLGYCSKGWLKGRIAIPLHDDNGRLIGYAGRLLDEKEATDEAPLYLLPQSRVHKGVRYELLASELVYHLHLIEENTGELFIVKSIDSTWQVWQNGYRNVVAPVSKTLSLAQANQMFLSVSRGL